MPVVEAGQSAHAPDIVIVGLHAWHGMWQRPQALAAALARTGACRVIYVNPPYFSVFGYLRGRRSWSGICQADGGVTVIDLPPLLPKGALIPVIARLNHAIQRPTLYRHLRALGVQRPVLMLTSPADHSLIDQSQAGCVIYDCMDRHALFYTGRVRRAIEGEQARLLASADGCIASAGAIADDVRAESPGLPVALIHNGVESSLLEAPVAPDPEIVGLPGPIIGFVGYVGSWVDVARIAAIAGAFPDGSVVVIGPLGADVSALRALPNVHFTGKQPHAHLSSIIDAFDVGIIPFHMSELTEAVHPLKVYDYLARGKPVVASPLRELLPLRDYVTLASDHEDWPRLIRLALEVSFAAQAEARRDFARSNTWDTRAVQVLDFVRKLASP